MDGKIALAALARTGRFPNLVLAVSESILTEITEYIYFTQ